MSQSVSKTIIGDAATGSKLLRHSLFWGSQFNESILLKRQIMLRFDVGVNSERLFSYFMLILPCEMNVMKKGVL